MLKTPSGKPRERALGIAFGGRPGVLNSITDVPGVEVGYTSQWGQPHCCPTEAPEMTAQISRSCYNGRVATHCKTKGFQPCLIVIRFSHNC